mgnify:FL=1
MDEIANRFIAEIYHTYYRKLYILAYSILGKQAEAEVAVQETFVVACQQPEKLMHSENPVGWMKSTVRHRALHILEDQKRTASLFMSLELLDHSKEPSCSDSSDSELAEFCQSVVTEDEFAFFLRIATGLSTFLEEARRQDIKLTTCYKRFERIRERLQQALSEFHKS